MLQNIFISVRAYCELTLVFPILEVGFHLEDWLNHTIFSNLWHFPWNYPWVFVDEAVDEMQKLLLSKLYQITRPLQDFPILWKIKQTQVKLIIYKFRYFEMIVPHVIYKLHFHNGIRDGAFILLLWTPLPGLWNDMKTNAVKSWVLACLV